MAKKLTNEDLIRIRQYWLDNPGMKGEYHVYKSCRRFIQLSKCSFHLRKEYWEEYDSVLWMALFDAFRTWDGSTTLFSWCWRLQMQATWRTIQSLTNKAKKMEGTVMLDIDADEYDDFNFFSELKDDDAPDSIYEKNENEEYYRLGMDDILKSVLKGPIEVEVYARMNGLFGFERQRKPEIARDMCLTEPTVDAICSRNCNRMSLFRKFLREEELTEYDTWITDYYKQKK